MGEAKTFGSSHPPSGVIETTDGDGIRTVTLSRPDRANALTPAGLTALEAAVVEADAPVVYLHGAGEAFCGGADLDTLATFDREEAVAFARHGQTVARAIETSDSVVVAGVDGAARGGGVELALACDIRVATPDATLAEPGVALGLFGAWGGTVRLPRVVGLGEAMDLALTGRVVDAEQARAMGLVSQVRADPRAVAETVAGHDAAAVRTVAGLLREGGTRSAQEAREATAFGELLAERTVE